MPTFANGRIPQSVLKQFGNTGKYGHPVLVDALTAAFAAVKKETGYTLYVATEQDIYRDITGQLFWRSYWSARGLPGNAAVPGTSNHGWARSVDISGLPPQGSPMRARVDAILARFGLRFDTHEGWHLTMLSIPVVNGLVQIGTDRPTVPAAPKPTPIPNSKEVDVLSDADKKIMADMAADADTTKQAVARLEARLIGTGPYTVEKNVDTIKQAVAESKTLLATISNGVGKILKKLGI